MVCGPYLANIITRPMARELQLINGLAVVLIAFIAGLEMNRYLEASGTTEEQCALVVEKNRRNALDNPLAAYPAQIAAGDVTGSDPTFGVRPLRRLVQSSISYPLARELLSGELAEGDTVRVDVDDSRDRLSVSTRKADEPALET